MTSGTELTRFSTFLRYFTGFVAIGVTGVACASTGLGEGSVLTTPSTVSSGPSPVPIEDIEHAEELRPTGTGLDIEVTRVTDGDSLRATSSAGDLEIRLLGINAPERDDCFGPEARAALEALLADGDVVIYPWPGETDQFDRQLGLLVAGETFVNLALVETGHVVARSGSDSGFDAEFEQAEQVASSAGLGLWASDACGEPIDAQVVIVEVEDDPPGDDRQNPNGEWVIFENRGDALALEGWVLRDESTSHRYVFPSVDVPPGATVQVFTGCGDDAADGDSITLFWCDPAPPVWNNGGDTAFLLDPNGAIADSYDTQR